MEVTAMVDTMATEDRLCAKNKTTAILLAARAITDVDISFKFCMVALY
jgi:hypothetical protein